jgi:hypothetical protein
MSLAEAARIECRLSTVKLGGRPKVAQSRSDGQRIFNDCTALQACGHTTEVLVAQALRVSTTIYTHLIYTEAEI